MEEKKKEELNTLLEKIKNINIREVEEKERQEEIEEGKEEKKRAERKEKKDQNQDQEQRPKEPKEKVESQSIETGKIKNTKKEKEKKRLVITERDREILCEISRWKCILGRQIRLIGAFDGQRACDRRLSKLIENEYLERKRYIYGISGIYRITPKAKKQFNINLPISEIRLDQIEHDIAVMDTAIYFIKHKGISKLDIVSEKQLRNQQGFTTRTHLPDFVYKQADKVYCVEVELSLKAKDRLEKNIKQNYMSYEVQSWIVPSSKVKIREILQNNMNKCPNIEILELEEIQNYVKSLVEKG